jgi:phenylpropionate dioxygenase-like ring-hydroxylating dioxygenase large terminal subunit
MFLSLTTDLKQGEVRPLPQYQNKKFLANDNYAFKIGDNVCPHQGSRILNKQTDHIMCQYHGWSWDIKGEPTGSGFTPVCNTKKLSMVDAFEHQSMLFSKQIELPELPISFDNFVLKEHRVDRVRVDDPTHIMNIFLDVDHIPIVHKKVYEKMGIVGDPQVEWEYFNNGSVQKVYHSTNSERPLIFMWLAIYPFTMIEWQQGSMFITDCFKTENGYTDIAVYKYKENFTSEYEYEINQSTWEIAWRQDKTQAEEMATHNSEFLEEQKLHYQKWVTLNGINP